MLDVAWAAQKAWTAGDHPGAKRAAEQKADHFRGDRSSAKDYRIEWPDAGHGRLRMTFYPDPNRGLTDPQIRTLEFDLLTGDYEVNDSYPFTYQFVVYSAFVILSGCAFLFVRWGARPLQKTRRWDRRMAIKKHEDEDVAVEYISRLRSR